MRSERVWFGFFVLLALTLNFGFVYGEISNPEHHDKLELFFAFIISLVCTIMKFGDRSHLGSLMLAASLVADVQLFCAVCAWTFSVSLLESSTMATIVSFTAGALIANIISVVLVVIEAATLRRCRAMNEVVYLILRQMRRPALILLVAYSVAMLGISLIPTINSEGEPSYLTLFQAFYWVSYTATTIGYGEMPQPFSEWQRMWVALSIYYTVPAWFYAIGKVIALLQDPTFQHALSESRFARQVAKQRHKFCIVCGFGEAGQRLVHLLLNAGYQCIVIDKDPVRISRMALDPVMHSVLAINGDAFSVELLLKAGVQSPHCRAVIAITDSEAVNIKVALAARLLTTDQTRFQIICRTYTRAGSANAKSFDTDAVINTNQIFALRLITALRRPAIAELVTRLQGRPGERHESPPQPPGGHWIICGNDALGKTLKRPAKSAASAPKPSPCVKRVLTAPRPLSPPTNRIRTIFPSPSPPKACTPRSSSLVNRTTAPISASLPSPVSTASWPKPTLSSAKSSRASPSLCSAAS